MPRAEERVVFDKFHVAKYPGEAMDKVRRQEHKALMAMKTLKAVSIIGSTTRRIWTRRQKLRLKALRDSTLKTARAWGIKESAMSLSLKTRARKG